MAKLTKAMMMVREDPKLISRLCSAQHSVHSRMELGIELSVLCFGEVSFDCRGRPALRGLYFKCLSNARSRSSKRASYIASLMGVYPRSVYLQVGSGFTERPLKWRRAVLPRAESGTLDF